MKQTLLVCILNTLLILVTTSVSDTNLRTSLHWKVEKEALEQNQQKYQKLKDDIKEIKEIINDYNGYTAEQILRNNGSTFRVPKDFFEYDENDYGVAPDEAAEYKATIMKQNRNENQGSQTSGISTKKYQKKLVTLNKKVPQNKASDLSPYGKKWREIVQIEDEYDSHNSSMVI